MIIECSRERKIAHDFIDLQRINLVAIDYKRSRGFLNLSYFDLATVTTYTFLISLDKTHKCRLTRTAQEVLLDNQPECLQRTGMLKSQIQSR